MADTLPQACQLQIFVNLLAELYLSYAPNSTAVSVVLLIFLFMTGLVALATEDFVRGELEKGWDIVKARLLQGRPRKPPGRRPLPSLRSSAAAMDPSASSI